MSDFPAGTVWLVGAGILDLASRSARRVYVGKRPWRHSQDQASIDRLIVAAALAGNRVVRLKGGDPAIFGRATEELGACRAAGVPVRICPGVTAASAAAASLGLSLTLRGLARTLVFVTVHAKTGEELELDWSALADPHPARSAAARRADRTGRWSRAVADRRGHD